MKALLFSTVLLLATASFAQPPANGAIIELEQNFMELTVGVPTSFTAKIIRGKHFQNQAIDGLESNNPKDLMVSFEEVEGLKDTYLVTIESTNPGSTLLIIKALGTMGSRVRQTMLTVNVKSAADLASSEN